MARQPLQKASRQAAIGEGHIGEAGSCDLDLVGISHDQLFHQLFAGAHHIDGIGRLVGRHTKEMPRRLLGQQGQQVAGPQHIVFQHSLNTVGIFLRPYMLVRRKVGHNVKRPFPLQQPRKHRITETNGVGLVIGGHQQAGRAAQVARELCEPVFVDIHHIQSRWLPVPQRGPNKRRANGAGTADDKHARAVQLLAQLWRVLLQVSFEEAALAADYVLLNEAV